MKRNEYDLVVVGSGSGGIGAAISGARQGLRVLLIDKADCIGGTATLGGVNSWAPAAGGTGLPFDIYCRLKCLPQAVGISSLGRHFSWQEENYWPHQLDKVNFPGGEHVIDPQARYTDSLQSHAGPGQNPFDEQFKRNTCHGVMFEPKAYVQVVTDMLAETGGCVLRTSTTIDRVEVNHGHVVRAVLCDGTPITSQFWVDATACAVFCDACGCETLFGADTQDRFNEPSAPKTPTNTLNGVTLIYRITPTEVPSTQPLDPSIPSQCWWANMFPLTHAVRYPNGDYNMNMLPTMTGEEFAKLSCEQARQECERRVHGHWHFVQSHWPEFQGYRIKSITPAMGVRESRRVVAQYMLTEHDLRKGLDSQEHEDIIAIDDHGIDVHGPGPKHRKMTQPYGIPYRCLIPKGMDNVLVACMAAGFSSIAASSCRLSRTMMQLGQAAGTAAALAVGKQVLLPQVPTAELRDRLRQQHVQLQWPMPAQLQAYLSES